MFKKQRNQIFTKLNENNKIYLLISFRNFDNAVKKQIILAQVE